MRLVYALHCCNRNNARVVFAGSLAMFSNEYFEAEGYGNEAFCIELSRSVLYFTAHNTLLTQHSDCQCLAETNDAVMTCITCFLLCTHIL
jgi:hypothetical protein